MQNEDSRWALVREEIEQIQKQYGDPRRSTIASDAEEVEYSAEDFIVEEDNVVIVSRDGWVKRQKDVKDISTTRLREGDQVLAVVAGSTRAAAAFFSNFGVAYSARMADIPASTGYGEPIQRFFKLKDGERIVAALSLDPRVAGEIKPRKEGDEPRVQAIAVTSDGYSLRFSLEPFAEPSTRAGRRFARPPESAEIVGVARLTGGEIVIAATREARAILTKAEEVNFLSGPGRGVILIKLSAKDDRVLGFVASTGDRDLLTVETSRGAEQTISTAKYEVTGRGGKGRELLQRGQFTRIVWQVPRRRRHSASGQASRLTHNRTMDLAAHYLADVILQFEKMKALADKAIAQVSDEELFRAADQESNSIAIVMRHIGGNLRSRFTDFLTSDGEKPSRDRDGEFEIPGGTARDAVLADWESGFARLQATLRALSPADVVRDVSIRGERMTVVVALNRAMTHVSSHVGQIVWMAKHFRSSSWKTLSIPRGQSRQAGTPRS